QLIDDVHADITPTILHQIDDLGLGQIGPDQRLIGGAARGMLDQGRAKVRVDLGILVEFPFPTPAGLADPGGGPLGEVLEVALPLPDGLGINAQELGDFLNPPCPSLAASTAAYRRRSCSRKDAQKVFMVCSTARG